MTKRLLQTLNGEPTDRPPFWFMRQAGRFLPEYRKVRAGAGGFLDLVYNSELACEVTLQPIRRFGMDGAILFSDILVIPDGLGQEVGFLPNHGPKLTPVQNIDDLNALDLGRVIDHMQPVFETLRLVKKDLPEHVTLIGFAGAPWTVATYMVEGGGSKDHAKTRKWALTDPEGFGKLIDILVEATSLYLIEQVKAGAETLQLFDSWAGSLSEKAYHDWVINPSKRIFDNIRREFPDIPLIGFPRGSGVLYKDFVLATGVNGVSVDYLMPAKWAAQELQPHVAVQGNLDPLLLVAGGDAMMDEVKRIVETFSGGRHIFNLGHGIVPETPPEHVEQVVDYIKGLAG